MKKRILSLLLVLVMVLGLLPGAALAASSEEEALGEVDIYNGGVRMDYLAVNGIVRVMDYTYFEYVDQLGKRQEIPAYCVNPQIKGVPQVVGPGESVKYIANEKGTDPKVMGIVANGYPTRGLSELKLENRYDAYYATKIAVWCYLLSNWDISRVTVNPNLKGEQMERAKAVLVATKDIYARGIRWTEVLRPSVTCVPDRDSAYDVTIGGKVYKQQVFTVTSRTWVCNYRIDVAFSDPASVPAGTRIVDMENNDISVITTLATGNDFAGKFKVLYPKESVAGESGSVQLSFKLDVYSYAIFYAVCAETDKYGQMQNYMCDTDPTRTMTISAISSYADEDGTPPETGLKIIKYETGTTIPLEGARFEVIAPDGSTVGTFATNARGEILLPLDIAGNYTVIEREAPQHHLLSKEPARTVTVVYDKLAEVTFFNDPYGSLQVRKLSNTGDYLQGVTVQIRHIESGATYTQQTGPAGVAFFDELKPGAYEVRETAGIPGWQADTNAVQTVTVVSGETADVSITNKELPGLRIIKYDRKTMQVMSGVTFEIWRDGVSLGKFRTDQFGEILLTDVEPGTFRAVEVDTGSDGHILDTTPQEIELKAGDGIRELLFFNDQKPGMRLIKVDSADPSKAIPNAVFEIKSVDGSYGPKEFATDQNGEIDLSKLPTGAYIVTEKSCEGYVIDDAQRIIQLDANETAQFVFTNTAKPSLKIVKTSSDGTPLKGVTFRIAKIEDGTHYLDRTSNEQGEILISDLEPGVYSVKETSTDSSHILDLREYHVALFPGKTSTLVIENQKRPNLIVYKHDADTGEPIPDTVFEVRAADGHSVDEIRTDSEGRAELRNLLPGVYEIIEKSVPSPWLLDAPSQLVTLYPNWDHTVYFENHQKPSLTVKKVDSVTGSPLQGAKFQIIYASSNTGSGEINDLGTYYTDENGQFHLTGLRDGWYKVTELEPPAGYAIKEATQEVYIKSGTSKTLTFENVPLSALVVKKIDSITGKGIPGVTFVLYDSGHNPIAQETSDDRGYVWFENLTAGRYYLRELENEGYVSDTELRTIYVRSGKLTELTWKNTPICGQIQIIKKSADDNTINGLPAGTLLEGAVFEVYDKAGNVVDTIKSDRNGRAVSRTLPLGRYTVREVQAPAYYSVNPTVMTAYLEYSGQIVTFEVEDSSISTGVSIKKTGPVEAVPGQPIRYVFSQIGNTSNIALDSFYWRDQLPAQVTLNRIVTGSYNQPLSYKVIYKTKLSGDYRTLADNLSASQVYVLDTRPAVLGLAANERITEVMFVFGRVKAGFRQVEAPSFYGTVSGGLANGTGIVNTADVGGLYNGQWIQAVSRWLTTVYVKTTVKLPKTGY